MSQLNSCTYIDDSEPWCCVKVDDEDQYLDEEFGYCSKDCDGEITSYQSQYNLARQAKFLIREGFKKKRKKVNGIFH